MTSVTSLIKRHTRMLIIMRWIQTWEITWCVDTFSVKIVQEMTLGTLFKRSVGGRVPTHIEGCSDTCLAIVPWSDVLIGTASKASDFWLAKSWPLIVVWMHFLLMEETAERVVLTRYLVLLHKGLLSSERASEVFLKRQIGVAVDEKHDHGNYY